MVGSLSNNAHSWNGAINDTFQHAASRNGNNTVDNLSEWNHLVQGMQDEGWIDDSLDRNDVAQNLRDFGYAVLGTESFTQAHAAQVFALMDSNLANTLSGTTALVPGNRMDERVLDTVIGGFEVSEDTQANLGITGTELQNAKEFASVFANHRSFADVTAGNPAFTPPMVFDSSKLPEVLDSIPPIAPSNSALDSTTNNVIASKSTSGLPPSSTGEGASTQAALPAVYLNDGEPLDNLGAIFPDLAEALENGFPVNMSRKELPSGGESVTLSLPPTLEQREKGQHNGPSYTVFYDPAGEVRKIEVVYGVTSHMTRLNPDIQKQNLELYLTDEVSGDGMLLTESGSLKVNSVSVDAEPLKKELMAVLEAIESTGEQNPQESFIAGLQD